MTIFCIFLQMDNWIWWFGHFFRWIEARFKNIGQPINCERRFCIYIQQREKHRLVQVIALVLIIYIVFPICTLKFNCYQKPKTGVPVNSRVVVLMYQVVLDKQHKWSAVLFNVECQKDILKYIRMVLFQIKHLLLNPANSIDSGFARRLLCIET
jgi:hypothetical protein